MYPTFSGKNIIKPTFFSDLNGLYNVAMLLDDMKYPWSDSTLLIGNQSENFWSIINATQGVHYLVVWLLCKLFPFVLAASLYLYFNWVLNGVMGFIVAREFGSNKFGSIVVGLLLQMTPFIREKLFNHFVYGTLGYILLVLYLAIKTLKQSNQKQTIYRLSFLLSIVIVGIFVDIVWFYSAALIFWITTLFVLIQRKKMWLLTVFSSFTMVLYFLISKLTFIISEIINATELPNRALAVTELSFIYQSGSSIKSFFFSDSLNSDFEYGHTGIVVFSLVLLGVLSLVRSTRRLEICFLSFIAIFFAILTFSPTIRIFGNEIDTPIKFLRHIFPGMRFFDRFGFIAVISLCIIVGLVLTNFSKLMISPLIKVLMGLVVFSLIVGDNHLIEKRNISNELTQYRPLREILNPPVSTTGVLNVPIWNKVGDLVNDYPNTPMFLLGSKTFYSYKHDLWLKELALFYDRGPDELANFLLSRGVTHIIENGSQTNLDLSSEHYSLVGHIKRGKIRLYEINEVNGTSFCSICSPYFVESSFVGLPIFNPVLKRRFEKIDSDIYWVEASSTKILKVTSTNHDAEYRVSFRFVPWYGAAAKANVVLIKAGKGVYSVPLFARNIGKLSLSVKEGETISLFSALGCHKGKDIDTQNIDARSICFGIEAINVEEIEK